MQTYYFTCELQGQDMWYAMQEGISSAPERVEYL